jgi:hypothetical protein
VDLGLSLFSISANANLFSHFVGDGHAVAPSRCRQSFTSGAPPKHSVGQNVREVRFLCQSIRFNWANTLPFRSLVNTFRGR